MRGSPQWVREFTFPMSDQMKQRYADYLVSTMSSHMKQASSYYLVRPRGTYGRPKLSDAEVKEAVRSARQATETAELVTIATHPWDRRADENARQYQAFCEYRDMGVDRTLKDVNMAIRSPWPKLYQWVQRVRAYDEWLEKKARKLAERQKKEMVERQAKLGQTMTDIAQTSLESGMILPETVADVVRLAESGTKIERLARGESTENVANAHTLVLSHPLPRWAPDEAKQLVQESEYSEGETIDGIIGSETKA